MARTLAEARLDKKRLLREIQAREIEQHRARVAALRVVIREARIARRAKLAHAATECSRDVEVSRADAEEAYKRARAAALTAKRAKKQAARSRCRLRADGIKLEAAIKKRDAERERAELERHRAEMRRIEAFAKSRSRPRSTAKERRGESDDEVLSNVPAHLHALFRRVRSTVKASPKMSRTEAFLHYVEERPRRVDRHDRRSRDDAEVRGLD